MPKSKDIPFSRMQKISGSGVFVKRFSQLERTAMKAYAHRDDYYMVVLLTGGNAAVEVDFERIELEAGDLLVVSPWQVHGKPADDAWRADGWLLALSPEMLAEAEAQAIDEYSIAPRPFKPDGKITEDIVALCSMLERNSTNVNVSNAIALAAKSFVMSSIGAADKGISGRYKTITLNLKKLLDRHLAEEKSPAAYASMLNISEVYLNEAVKGATGISAGAYIRGRVIVHAKRQLAYTTLSAKEIAYALGYDDYVYFSKLFKKIVGQTPSEYRRNLK